MPTSLGHLLDPFVVIRRGLGVHSKVHRSRKTGALEVLGASGAGMPSVTRSPSERPGAKICRCHRQGMEVVTNSYERTRSRAQSRTLECWVVFV